MFDALRDRLDVARRSGAGRTIIGGVRRVVDRWRERPEAGWQVTPETARLLKHWRGHRFAGVRPFFCQVEAAETAIWLTEVAPRGGREERRLLDQLDRAAKRPARLRRPRALLDRRPARDVAMTAARNGRERDSTLFGGCFVEGARRRARTVTIG